MERRVVTSESQFLHKIIDVVTWTLIQNNCQFRVSDGLMQLLKGGQGAKGSGKVSEDSARDKSPPSDSLDAILFECIVLFVPEFCPLLSALGLSYPAHSNS